MIGKKPLIALFGCTNSVIGHIEDLDILHKSSIKLQEIPCSSKIEIIYLLKALEAGADGVLVIGCPDGACQFRLGNVRAERRVEYCRKLLEEAGLSGDSVMMVKLGPEDRENLVNTINDFSKSLVQLKTMSGK